MHKPGAAGIGRDGRQFKALPRPRDEACDRHGFSAARQQKGCAKIRPDTLSTGWVFRRSRFPSLSESPSQARTTGNRSPATKDGEADVVGLWREAARWEQREGRA